MCKLSHDTVRRKELVGCRAVHHLSAPSRGVPQRPSRQDTQMVVLRTARTHWERSTARTWPTPQRLH